ncbi:MAG: MFS transporter [Proteobacteria bacterium]|nr:MFS transporter [Pseudomonadota bacterium]
MGGSVSAARGIESGRSWVIAGVALLVLSIAYGAPLVTVVALAPIAAEFGTQRAAPALAVSLTYVGSGLGGIAMGWLAGRIGMRAVAMFCGCMIALGLFLASKGGLYSLYACNLLLLGLLGGAGMFAPTIAYVTRWFDRRRGSAVALVSSGQYVAGVIWPVVLAAGIQRYGWRTTMLLYSAVIVATVPILAAIFYRTPPDLAIGVGGARAGSGSFRPVAGLAPNVVLAILAAAIFCCCVTMSIPLSHMVAFCGDIGIGAQSGAAMLSVQLGAGVIAQQIWGWVADRVGGLRTILYASIGMATATGAFLLTQDEIGLYSVSGLFGLAFGGLIPGYILAIREIFPAAEASWRVPAVLFPGALGMAAGGWLAGLIHDSYGYYAPAFVAGVAFNLVNLMLIGILVPRHASPRMAAA